TSVALPTSLTFCQYGLVVSRQTISYPATSGSGLTSQRRVVSFSSLAVRIRALDGDDGAFARCTSTAAFNRATLPRYAASTNSGTSPYGRPFFSVTFW